MDKRSKVVSLYDYDFSEINDFAEYVERQTTIKIMRTIETKIIDHVLENSCWNLCDYTKPLQEVVDLLSTKIELMQK